MVYFLELMTSWLVWAPSSPEMSSDFIPQEHGAFLIAMNPNALGTKESLEQSVEKVNSELKNQTPKEWEKISIPWERSNIRLKKNKSLDIEIDEVLYEKLKNL